MATVVDISGNSPSNGSEASKPSPKDATYANITGDTFTGKVYMAPATAAGANFNAGYNTVTPSTAENGDIWIQSNSLVFRGLDVTYVVAKLTGSQTIAGATIFTVATKFMGSTATPAGGATTANINFGTAGIGIYFGSGAPTVTAVKGSMYLRSDGSGAADRMYINTTGAAVWTNVVTAA